MNKTCANCHYEIADDATVCPNCGANQAVRPGDDGTAPANEEKSEKLSSKLDIPSLIGVIAGGFCSVSGIFILVMSGTIEMKAVTFGADFYTYIYDGLIQLVEIVNNAQNILALGFGFSLLFFGIFMVCYFLRTISVDQDE